MKLTSYDVAKRDQLSGSGNNFHSLTKEVTQKLKWERQWNNAVNGKDKHW